MKLIPAFLSLVALGASPVFADPSCCGTSGETNCQTAEVGKPAPDFKLPGSDGKEHTLSASKGRITVLEWTNPECPFVKKFDDSGEIQKLQKELIGKGVVWYRVNSSNPENNGYQTVAQAADYNNAKKIPAVTLIDADGKVGQCYAAKTTPHIYVIDKEGTLVYNGAIDDKPSKDAADIATAKNYVRQVVNELAEGKSVSVSTTKPYGCGVKYAKK